MQKKEKIMDDINNPENNIMSEPEELGAIQPENMSINPEELTTSWDKELEEETPSVAEHLKDLISGGQEQKDLEAVFEVPVKVSAVLGSASMPVHQLLKLGRGAVIELDRRIGEAIDIYVNNLLVARGEVVMVEDRLGITMTEIIKSKNKV